ncbi:DUF4440 domain-containing protein [Halobacillus sp. ACCC02827]|uniref:nuclear transport factor 2 family protein n=1 Tax=Halobacillus sp. ACCC02827 TaxID=3052090 RepID=UPI002570B735|nr:DUF4440 domain-containing protein [Halobacillus sp. ACCC02827]WJE16957.1 DUF4440 domain-containing protein [Halobacillus sp. ACCC02827]
MVIDTKSHFKQLEESHLRTDVRESPEKLGEILAEDFWEIGSSGKKYDREACQKGVVQGEMELYHFEIQSLADDTVLTTYYLKEKTRERNTLRSSIWKLMEGRWRLFFHQGTITDLKVEEYAL